jgi:hypothetical protein
LVFAEMLGAELDDDVPASWLDVSRSKGSRRLPPALIDPPTHSDGKEMAEVVQVVEQVKKAIPLLHG